MAVRNDIGENKRKDGVRKVAGGFCMLSAVDVFISFSGLRIWKRKMNFMCPICVMKDKIITD